jgi:hypothetical protein
MPTTEFDTRRMVSCSCPVAVHANVSRSPVLSHRPRRFIAVWAASIPRRRSRGSDNHPHQRMRTRSVSSRDWKGPNTNRRQASAGPFGGYVLGSYDCRVVPLNVSRSVRTSASAASEGETALLTPVTLPAVAGESVGSGPYSSLFRLPEICKQQLT